MCSMSNLSRMHVRSSRDMIQTFVALVFCSTIWPVDFCFVLVVRAVRAGRANLRGRIQTDVLIVRSGASTLELLET